MEQLLKEEFRRLANVLRELQLIETDGMVQLFIVLALEWELSAEKSKQEDAQGPDICRWARILNLSNNFWRHVRWCAAEELDFLFVRDASRESKVN